MSTQNRSVVFATLLILSLSCLGGLVLSKWYWGYWAEPPSLLPWIERLECGGPVMSFEAASDKRAADQWNLVQLSAEEITDLRDGYYSSPIHYFWLALPAQFEEHHLPGCDSERGSQEAAQAALDFAWNSPGPSADRAANDLEEFRGFILLGRANNDRQVAIVTASGGEVSNDHHVRYHFLLALAPGDLTPLDERRYFADVAGIEGARWYHFSVFFALALGIAGCGLWFVITQRRDSR